jgi:phosphoserine phosphatase
MEISDIMSKMPNQTASQWGLDRFLFGDAKSIKNKLADFSSAGPEKLHIVSDFDLTLTAGKLPGQNLGTWDVMDELMPPEGVAKHNAIYKSFRPTELAGKLTREVTAEKWAETLDLITSYHMRIDDVEAAFLSIAKLREGAKELFDVCESAHIPTVILSSGIRNVVRLMTDHYRLRPDFILSNDLEIDDSTRRVSGWRRDSLVHMQNKNEMGHDELSKLRSERPNVILLGDVPDDVKMVTGDDVIRIRVHDPRKGELHDVVAFSDASFAAGYDLVVEQSLEPVVRMVQWLSTRRE